MSPITQTFTKDNSPVCRRTHHKGTQEKGSLFPPLGFPLPSIQDICGTASCHWMWRTCGYLLFATTRRRKVLSLYFYYPGHGRSLTAEKCPCHPLRSYLHRNRAVPRDHAVSVADLESDCGFRQSSAVSQNIKNLKQKRHLSISASFSTLL